MHQKTNKSVVLLSSEQRGSEVDKKPEIVLDYNKAKGGVDHLEQMCTMYTTRKQTLRWPKCVFQHMVDVSAYNAFILWLDVTERKNIKRRQFLKMLEAELCICGREIDKDRNIKLIQTQSAPTCHSSAKSGKRLLCRRCISNKTVWRCNKCFNPLCINCVNNQCYNC